MRRRRRIFKMFFVFLVLILVLNFNKHSRGKSSELDNEKRSREVARDIDDLDLSGTGYLNYEHTRNRNIEDAIRDYMDKDELGKLEYFYNYIDLNGDGLDEKLVYLRGDYVSGYEGSPMLILDENYNLITSISLTRLPVIIDREKTDGWNNIILSLSSGGGRRSMVRYEYYKGAYSYRGEVFKDEELEGIEILSGDTSKSKGIRIN